MMHVDVIIDVVCPWCYVGKRRLDQAVAACEEPLDVQYRPFLLAPDMPLEGKDRRQHFAEKFGPDVDLSKMTMHLRSQAEDIDFQFDKIQRVPNTVHAHRLIGWAYAQNRQAEVVEAIFAAYFTRGEDIGSVDVLAKIAAACGMDAEIVTHLLQTDKDAEIVRSGARQAAGMGIQGVPFYIFGGAVALSGAQNADVLLQAVTKAKEAAAA